MFLLQFCVALFSQILCLFDSEPNEITRQSVSIDEKKFPKLIILKSLSSTRRCIYSPDCNSAHVADKAPTLPPPSMDPDAMCPLADGWEEFNGFCYYVSSSAESSISWLTAIDTCRLKGGLAHNATLASIHNKAENTYIMNRLIANRRSRAWIGLSKLEYGAYNGTITNQLDVVCEVGGRG